MRHGSPVLRTALAIVTITRTDYTADALRRLALGTRDANVARRLLLLAAVRGDAAPIGTETA